MTVSGYFSLFFFAEGEKYIAAYVDGIKQVYVHFTQDEVVYLKTLCAPYRHDKTIPWKYVIYPYFQKQYGDKRTKEALVAKWKIVLNDQDFEDEERTGLA